MTLTDEERQKMEAIAALEDLALDKDLSNMSATLDKLLAVPDSAKVQPTDKAELSELIRAIRAGTAQNEQYAKFLGIIRRLVP